jgi:hypothetical protein
MYGEVTLTYPYVRYLKADAFRRAVHKGLDDSILYYANIVRTAIRAGDALLARDAALKVGYLGHIAQQAPYVLRFRCYGDTWITYHDPTTKRPMHFRTKTEAVVFAAMHLDGLTYHTDQVLAAYTLTPRKEQNT